MPFQRDKSWRNMVGICAFLLGTHCICRSLLEFFRLNCLKIDDEPLAYNPRKPEMIDVVFE
jgi:hypothetical protein